MLIKIEKKVLSVCRFGPPLGATLVVQLKCSDTKQSPTGWTARCVIHMGRQVQGLSGEGPAFAPPAPNCAREQQGRDRPLKIAHRDFYPEPRALPDAVRSGRRSSVTCSTNADLAPARCRPSGSTKPLLPGEPAFPPDRHFRRTLCVVGVVTSCLYRCRRCGSWRGFCGSSPPLLSSLPPFPSLDGGRLSVADSLTRP